LAYNAHYRYRIYLDNISSSEAFRNRLLKRRVAMSLNESMIEREAAGVTRYSMCCVSQTTYRETCTLVTYWTRTTNDDQHSLLRHNYDGVHARSSCAPEISHRRNLQPTKMTTKGTDSRKKLDPLFVRNSVNESVDNLFEFCADSC